VYSILKGQTQRIAVSCATGFQIYAIQISLSIKLSNGALKVFLFVCFGSENLNKQGWTDS